MKILIVEDEKGLSESVVTYLKSEDYVCETALTFNAALQKTETCNYDCILLDIYLPGGNGLDILRQLRVKNRKESIIVISGKKIHWKIK